MARNTRTPAASTLAIIALAVGMGASCASARSAPQRDPNLRSVGVLVVDQADSSVLLSKHAGIASPIASITKLMTALVVLDAGQSLSEPIEIADTDQDFGKGWFSRLSVGTVLSRGDMMHLALMASENRAAHALGSNYPGGVPALVAAMNAKALSLGMTTARFVDPTGLSSDNVASPEDLAKLVIAASKNSTIRDFSTDPSYTVRVRRHLVEFHNTDRLVANPAWDIVVQKTGYITEAGRCLVMETVVNGRSLVIVLLDSFGKYTRLADATRVRNWVATGGGTRLARVSMR